MSDIFDEATRATIYERLDRLNEGTPARWGRMSASQMLTHMNDAFRISMGMKKSADKSSFYSRNIMFPVAVYLVPFWPKNEKTADEMNPDKDGSKPRDFYTELEFLKKMIDVFNEREPEKFKPHPMFGQLSKKQWRD